jgi:peptide/nickel transport system substrate-binding protein
MAMHEDRARNSVFPLTRRQALINIGIAAGAAAIGGPAHAATGEVVIQKNVDSAHFDPHKIIDVTQGEILPLVTDTLVAVGDDLATVYPGLATSWTISPDRLVYTFVLRQDVSFHDGKKLTAAMVAASFTRWLSPQQNSGNRTLMGPLQTIEAKGDYSVNFTLSEPFADFLLQLTQPYAGIIDAENAKALGDQFGVTGLNGTGPYVWEKWTPREQISLRRNPAYKWGPKFYDTTGPVQPSRLVFKIVADDNARTAAMLAGQQAISYQLPWSAIADFRRNARFKVVEPPAFGWVAMLCVRVERPIMKDIAVRKALNQAIDRDGFAKAIYSGEADPAYSVISPKFSDFSKASEVSFTPYDPAAVDATLNKAGWVKGPSGIREKNGQKLSLTLIGITNWRERAETVQALFRDVGIDLKVEMLDVAAFLTRMLTKDDYDLWCYYGAYMTAGEFFSKYVLSSVKLSTYRAAKEVGADIDQAITAGRAASSDADRIAHYKHAQDLIAAKYLYVPLVHQRDIIVYNTDLVSGVKPHGYTGNGLYKAIDLKSKV